MSLTAAMVAELVRAGMKGEALIAACERLEESSKPTVKSNAQRQAEWRAREKEKRNENNVTPVTGRNENNARNVTHVTASRVEETPRARAEPEPNKTTSSPVQKDILTDIPKVPAAKPKSADAKCVAELGKVLDPQHALAVVEHRNRMRKPMTAHAAGLLAKRLSEAPDPNAAADEMIERGWQGWRPEWGQNSQAPPLRQARRNSALDDLNDLSDRMFGNVQHFPRIAG